MEQLDRCKTAVVGLALLALPTFVSATNYYVDDDGNDLLGANPCTLIGSPCKTISHAVSVITTDGTAGSPHVITVLQGTYDETANAEVFPISITYDYISLVGVGGASLTVIDSDINVFNLFNVSGQGVSFSGFTFDNASYAINYDHAAGFTVQNNIFTANSSTGVYGYFDSVSASSSITVGPVSFLNNQFSSTSTGVDFRVPLQFDGSTTGLSAAIGAITATGNTFTGCSYGFRLQGIAVYAMDTGTVTVGNINVSNNTLTSCSEGIRLDGLAVLGMDNSTVTWGDISIDNNTIDDNGTAIQFSGSFGKGSPSGALTDTSLTLGNMTVNSNTITNNTSYGLQIDYFDANSIHGTSTITFGTFTVDGNTVSSQNMVNDNETGISIDSVGSIESLFDSTTVITGAVSVTNNIVESQSMALYLAHYGVYGLGIEDGSDTVAATIGATTISGNQLTSTDSNALYFEYRYFGEGQSAQTTLDVALATVHNNTITSTGDEAFYLYYLYHTGYEMYNDAEIDIAGLVITDNTISSTSGDGLYLDAQYMGYDIYDDAKTMIGPSTITGNTITASSDGIYVYMDHLAEETNNTSSVTLGPWNISNNTITATSESLYVYFENVGYNMYDTSSLMMSPWTINNNTLDSGDNPSEAALSIEYYEYTVTSNMEVDSSATLPDWIISNNNIDVQDDYSGIYFYSYSSPDNNIENAAAHFGSMTIHNNIFNQDKDAGMEDAIYFYLEDVCEDCDGSSTFSHGDVVITNNSINNVSDNGIYLEIDEFGYAFDDDGQATMGNFTIANNMIDMAASGIYVQNDVGNEDLATVTYGTLDITDNTLSNVTEEGIYSDMVAYRDDGTGTVTIGKTTISGNTITAASSGLGTDTYGIGIEDDIESGISSAESAIESNTASGFHIGIQVTGLEPVGLRCNTAENNSTAGLCFATNGAVTAQYNSLVDNGLGVQIAGGSSAAVEAKDNWWGDALGPVACTSCNKIDVGGGSVNYTPWLKSAPRSQCGGTFPWVMFVPALSHGVNK